EHAVLQLHVAEAVAVAQLERVLRDRLRVAQPALVVEGAIAVEDVRGELDPLALDPAPEVAAALAEGLADDVPARHLDRGAGELECGRAPDLLARDAVDREPLRDPPHLERVEPEVERLRLVDGCDELGAAVRLAEADDAL